MSVIGVLSGASTLTTIGSAPIKNVIGGNESVASVGVSNASDNEPRGSAASISAEALRMPDIVREALWRPLAVI